MDIGNNHRLTHTSLWEHQFGAVGVLCQPQCHLALLGHRSGTGCEIKSTSCDWNRKDCQGLSLVPSLPPALQCGFESRLGLELSGFSMWHFLKLVVRGFLWVLRFFPSFIGLIVQPIR